MDVSAPGTPEFPDQSPAAAAAASSDDDDARVYLVPYRWWREAQELESDEGGVRGILYAVSPPPGPLSYGMKIISIFSSDLVFNLKKDDYSIKNGESEEGDGVSGRTYALIPADLWSQALKWHMDAASKMANSGSTFSWEDGTVDLYFLMLRISVQREAKIMTVKISKKDNAVESYKRACKIFSVDSEVRIWDFSGQTDLIFMNEWNRQTRDGQRQADQEILLELQVYAISESLNCRNAGKKDDLAVQQSKMTSFPHGGSVAVNGSIGNSNFYFSGSSNAHLGLTGLDNLGNTCFMNSAIQCLAHTPKLVHYFLGDYGREINHKNPLGMNGELALAFGELLRKLWDRDRTPLVPRMFKSTLARFAPQFSGFNQHDSQEFLAFLLDGLHEDLNRVKCKPYVEVKDACGRSDEEVADEYWSNHLARNDSIIVDVCQGQYRSTLVCPVCNKLSVTFDPFMYLSLPLPSSATRTMTITVFSADGSSAPSSYTINVPKFGKCKDLMQALSISCSLRDNESLLIAEVYTNHIIRYLEDPSDAISLIRDGDRLAAYRLLKDDENLPLVVFTHQRMERYIIASKKPFGVPFVARLPVAANGYTIRNIYLKLLNPFRRSSNATSGFDHDNGNLDIEVNSCNIPEEEGKADAAEEGDCAEEEFQFYVTDDKCLAMLSKIDMDESASLTGLQNKLNLIVDWEDKSLENYDTCLLNSLPEIYKSGLFSRRPQEPISLYACLEAFLKEEPLGPEDMWFCPSCKKHQQACKKLDLWRLPEILVIHLKRFSYSRFLKNKLEAFVDFPIHDFDLSKYFAYKTKQSSHRYSLYAISNHYGNMGGGHYTAYVYHDKQNCWYDFDDRYVHPLSDEASIKTSAAYVLFYRRVQAEGSDAQSTTSICSASPWRDQAEGSDAQSSTTSPSSSPWRDEAEGSDAQSTNTSIDSSTRSTTTSISSSSTQPSVTSVGSFPTQSTATAIGSSCTQYTAAAVAVAVGSSTQSTSTLIGSSSDHNSNSLN